MAAPEIIDTNPNLTNLLETTGPDEPGVRGALSRNDAVRLLAPPLLDMYQKVAMSFLRGDEVIAVDIHPAVQDTWTDLMGRWETRSPIHLNGYAERGAYLKYGEYDLLWVPEDPNDTYKVPRYPQEPYIPSSLARVAEVLLDADALALMAIRGMNNPVKLSEMDSAMAAGDGRTLRDLTIIMMFQGKTSGIGLEDLINYPNPGPAEPKNVQITSTELKPPYKGFRPRAIGTFSVVE